MGRVPSLLALAIAPLALFTAAAGAAPAPNLQCGAVVTASVKLTHDIKNCPEDGLVVGADGITIDLNGHKITGTTGDGSAADGTCSCGVYDDGHDHVTVLKGRIDGFDDGVRFSNTTGVIVRGLTATGHWNNGVAFDGSSSGLVTSSRFEKSFRGVSMFESHALTVRDSTFTGIEHAGVAMFTTTDSVVRDISADLKGGDYGVEIVNSSHNLVRDSDVRHHGLDGVAIADLLKEGSDPAVGNVIRSNHIHDGSTGIELLASDGTTIRDTQVVDNRIEHTDDVAILVHGVTSSDGMGTFPFEETPGEGPSGTLIAGNTATHDASDGIQVDSVGNTLTANTARNNGGYGIFAWPGNTDGGHNRASGNQGPAQCSGVACT